MQETTESPVSENNNGAFFRKLEWSAFWTACVLTFAVYFYTLAPTLTLEDCGELAVAGDYLGVPHPPGYPIWSMLAWIFTKLFAFVPFRGQPNPAWSIGLMSAVFGSLAAGMTAMLICRSGSDMLSELRQKSREIPRSTENLICWVGGVVASLLFAFSPVMWSQSVIVEVYSLNAFFLILIFLLTYHWMCRPTDKLLYLAAFVFGLGLTNYQILLLAALPLIVVVLLKDLKLFRDFLVIGTPFAVTVLLIKTGHLKGIVHPLHLSCFIYVSLNFIVLVLAYFFLPRGKTVALTVLLVELGVAFYAYMPIVSDLRNPPMNWGYPRTWEGFKHALTRGQYERINPTDVFSIRFIQQIGAYLTDLRMQFTLLAAPLGFLPFAAWHMKISGRRIKALYIAIALSLLAIVVAMAEKFLFPTQTAFVILYKLFFCGVIVLVTIGGLAILISQAKELILKLLNKAPAALPERFTVALGRNSQKWVIATLSGFLAMSIVLIVLANPKGDIQDTFIQRVKFISSHALYAFWIGYGLILGLAFVNTLLKDHRIMKWLSLSTAMILPLVPIHQNYYNSELIRRFGGAEQNGHDFGWQFGNYQLCGAEAISEELDPDEEPLPNPAFPPEMGKDAIFFGGTDPGRFVPTYMIYSARVREDVYLITQNALADNTYMSVMRDLYGDRIWIPAHPDSASAFRRYVEEVKSGKRPKSAALLIKDGRVQVSGALGVMEINGILAQMIFEHNNYKHDFYVEESYVIRWMYPYLTPHGLIMKINRDKTRLTDEIIRNDMDFWNWYTRRLIGDNRFTRDIVARKSFSKLRSAIGGLYSSRGKLREAEKAFQQARTLYPLSPEANFRLVQEVYMRQGRFPEARAVITEFGENDSGNRKVPGFLGHLDRVEKLGARIREMEAQISGQKGKIDVNKAFELAELYLQAGQMPKFMPLASGILQNTNFPSALHFRVAKLFAKAKRVNEMIKALDQCVARIPPNTPPEVFLDIAKMYAGARQPEKMKTVLQEYLKRKPADWKAWLDLTSLQIGLKQTNAAVKSLEHAIRLGGNEAMAIIKKDQRFTSIRNQAMSHTRDLMAIPGIPGIPPATRGRPRFTP